MSHPEQLAIQQDSLDLCHKIAQHTGHEPSVVLEKALRTYAALHTLHEDNGIVAIHQHGRLHRLDLSTDAAHLAHEHRRS
jgi:hypothetical protein